VKLRPEIIYEDEDLVVVNKPSGWLSIPGRQGETKNCVSSFLKKSRNQIFTVHRIDKETSGVLIYAKNEDCHKALNHQFQNRSVKKIYHGLLVGDLANEVIIDKRLEKSNQGLVKVSKSGKSAESRFNPLERFGSWTFAEIKITSGRTHQIRVHASYINHPLVADPLYGDGQPLFIHQIKRIGKSQKEKENQNPLFKRTALHAYELSLMHPTKKEQTLWQAKHPKDFKATLNQLRKWRKLIEK